MKYGISMLILVVAGMSATANANEVAKDKWLDGMSTALPTAFCNSDQYFRKCFKISQQQCIETATSATQVCLNKYSKDIPKTLIQPKDGTHWGTLVGRCAGEAFEVSLLKKRIHNENCDNVENWK